MLLRLLLSFLGIETFLFLLECSQQFSIRYVASKAYEPGLSSSHLGPNNRKAKLFEDSLNLLLNNRGIFQTIYAIYVTLLFREVYCY